MKTIHRDDHVEIRGMSAGPYDNNVYIVSCAATSKAVIVDAAAEPGQILEGCAELQVEAILTTHGHHDHLGALDEVKDRLSIPWRMHLADVDIAERTPDEPLTDREEIHVGEVALHVVHTPGHTPGSVCFVVEPVLLSGDTLFPGGPGATRWSYSSFGQIMDSIEQRIFPLPDTTLVHPGHGAPTTLGTERPHAEEWRARGW